jgi:hypothetical protein
METSIARIRWETPPLLVGLCLLLGMGMGAATNIINGRVSPIYFVAFMAWDEDEAPTKAIPQGMLEGGALGLSYGIVLSIAAAASTRLRCSLSLAARAAVRAVPLSLGCWIIGGIIGMIWEQAGGPLYQAPFARVPPAGSARLAYAWVGGSIVGGYASAFIGALYVSIWLHLHWKKRAQSAAQGFEILPANR